MRARVWRTTRSVPSVLWLMALICASGLSPAEAQPPPEVYSADPSSAEQATVDLDVAVAGENFGPDSEVSFFVTGTKDTGGIKVKGVKVRGPKKLIANIDIAADATIDKFDIEVLSGGRRGKGTELFSVLEQGSTGEGLENAGLLARVDFQSLFGGVAVSGDGTTVTCVDPAGVHGYADSHDDCWGSAPPELVKSDVSKNGGRWMFFSTYPVTVEDGGRPVRVDFAHEGTEDCEGDQDCCKGVADLLFALGVPGCGAQSGPGPCLTHDSRCTPGSWVGPCAFELQARITADRAFKANANRDTPEFGLPTKYEDGRWKGALGIDYVNPLFLCEESVDVRYLQTESCPGTGPYEDVSHAEVWDTHGRAAKKNWTWLGACRLPMKIRLERAPCKPELCEGPA